MRLIGNVIWLLLGGLEMAIAWFICGLIMFVSIIGIPWGRSCFELGMLALWPFGRQAVHRESLGKQDIGTGALGCVGNILWFVFAGIWLAIGHVFFGIVFCITIIGIPFGIQHFKLAGLALAPIGKTIVDK